MCATIKEFVCDCGNPAVRKKNSFPICQRCLDIESKLGIRANARSGLAEKKLPICSHIRWETRIVEVPIQVGASLEILDIWLRDLTLLREVV